MARQYLLFDTALNGPHMLLQLQAAFPEYQSLFHKTKDQHLIAVAPFLFRIREGWLAVLRENKLQPKACVVIETGAEIEQLAEHLKEYIYKIKEGKEYYFRFWDARVLAACLVRWAPVAAAAFWKNARAITCYPEYADHGTRFELSANGMQQTAVNNTPVKTEPHTPDASVPQPTFGKKVRTFLL